MLKCQNYVDNLTIMNMIKFMLSWVENIKSFLTLSPGPEVINFFSCSTQLCTKFILLINLKCQQAFISMIATTSERLKARNLFICRYFSFYEQLKFCAQLSWACKKFLTSSPGLKVIKLEYILKLKIKCNDWLLADTCLMRFWYLSHLWVCKQQRI